MVLVVDVVVVVVEVSELQASRQVAPAGTTSCVGVPMLVFTILYDKTTGVGDPTGIAKSNSVIGV